MGLSKEQWTQLIAERNQWVAYNFPGPDMPNTIIGVFEECGELAHHHLKEDQNIRGDTEFHQEEARDAIGDIVIYLLGVMNHISYIPSQQRVNPMGAESTQLLLNIGKALGKLLSDPSADTVQFMVNALERYCMSREWDFNDIVITTWERVSRRDWQKDRAKGGEVV